MNLPCKFLDVPEWAKPYVSYAAEKALELGLIDEVQKIKYMRSNLFYRDDVCNITNKSLNFKLKDGTTLGSKFSDTVTGEIPYATYQEKMLDIKRDENGNLIK